MMKLDPNLSADSVFIADWDLCQVRLIPDGDNTWFLLIPRRENMVDWGDLSRQDQYALTDEISRLSELIKQEVAPDKINVASLGNMVPQLHIHIIARYKNDRAWPGPIWGSKPENEFDPTNIDKWKDLLVV